MVTPAPLLLRGRIFDASRPAVMAIVNRTRDSFYAGNRHHDDESAFTAVESALTDGADIIDVGGVRAGQEGETVSIEQEIDRVVPFLIETRRRHPEVILSLDTWRAPVASAAAEAGLDLVNDTWAGHDPQLVEVAARIGAGIVCSHSGGLPPRTDPVDVHYAHDGEPEDEALLSDVRRVLTAGAHRALSVGIPRDRILLDPTLDFGKTTAHSLVLLRNTSDLVDLGFPVLQAISRKDFVGESLDLPADERLEGSLAATAIAAWQGATVFRTHDVRATRRVLDMVATIRGDRPPVRQERGVSGSA
ncbi:dihydropteroate synthase [Branchiibius hedensis]|uniref:Dihydropteroate synthase n=1 Tax=Branchiibius hedensis TaxID=672460 RepID=A0A2Y8ZWF9_9MICO|nr:dihydropteroate synthase [Branchiibius hedensis]PWJ25796.1 dihydropteroate synthase [Branchiibius hedensis]SSA34609.1 Dihydropteroate synthase [Branchiibius hedensis]